MTLIGLSIFFFFFQIIGIEFVIFKYFSEQRQRTILNKTIPNWMWESYRHIGVFGFGAACSQLTTDVAKYTIGRLRPHFFSVCQPDIDCRLLTNQNVYIERFHCRGGNPKLLKDMRLSFPSGHSSFSTYCALFLVVSKFFKFSDTTGRGWGVSWLAPPVCLPERH